MTRKITDNLLYRYCSSGNNTYIQIQYNIINRKVFFQDISIEGYVDTKTITYRIQ